MSLKNKFLKMLGELTDEEKAIVKDFLSETEPAPNPDTGQEETAEGAPKEETHESTETPAIEQAAEPQQKEEVITETKNEPQEESLQEDNTADIPAEEPQAETVEDEGIALSNEDTPFSDADDDIDSDTDIPTMSKDEPSFDEDTQSAVIDTEGEPMPIDYKSIIDGLNARLLAQDAEIANLKTKTEGAFGYSSKPPGMAKVNPLYDENIEDIHFRK